MQCSWTVKTRELKRLAPALAERFALGPVLVTKYRPGKNWPIDMERYRTVGVMSS
jgi:hypothetical protein